MSFCVMSPKPLAQLFLLAKLCLFFTSSNDFHNLENNSLLLLLYFLGLVLYGDPGVKSLWYQMHMWKTVDKYLLYASNGEPDFLVNIRIRKTDGVAILDRRPKNLL